MSETLIGHGIDAVDIAGISRLLAMPGKHFERRCFADAERDACRARADPASCLAGRFAAKEAVLKALGTGWSNGIAWTDVEITALPGGALAPMLRGRAAKIADDLRVTRWLLSISHTEAIAFASAIAVGSGS